MKEASGLGGEQKQGSECENCTRRQFFVKAGMSSLMAAAAGAAVFSYQYFSPNVLYEPSPIVKAGKPDQFPAGSVTLDPQFGIFVVNGPNGFYALQAICTHLGCLTAWKPELEIIACPCHGSQFRADGTKIAGPAPQPLPWYKMWLSEEGDLMVDRSQVLQQHEYVNA